MNDYQTASDEYDTDYARLVSERNKSRGMVVGLVRHKQESGRNHLSLEESEAIRKYLEIDRELTRIIKNHNKNSSSMLPREEKPNTRNLVYFTKPKDNNSGCVD